MTYELVVLRRAEQELNAAADWIAEYSPGAAARWFNSFVHALLSLEKNPQRCGLAPENVASSYELRQLIYRPRQGRSFRAIFTIQGNQVRVLRIRGAGQDLLSDEEIEK
jgi:plasmid stabilization system protein ParE